MAQELPRRRGARFGNRVIDTSVGLADQALRVALKRYRIPVEACAKHHKTPCRQHVPPSPVREMSAKPRKP